MLFFGRDSLRVAVDLIYKYPTLTKTTLVKLAELQGVEFIERREEEVGKIIHEYRDPIKDSVARELTEQRGWDWPYFGSVDSTKPMSLDSILDKIQSIALSKA